MAPDAEPSRRQSASSEGAAAADPLPPPRAPGSPRPAVVRPPEPRSAAVGFWLYASHLFTLFGIALSNVLAGLTLLSAPWTVRPRAHPAAAPDPLARTLEAPRRWLLGALAAYVAWLGVSVAASTDPRISTGALSELFTVTTLLLALGLVRGERRVRRVVDGLLVVAGLVAAWGLLQALGDYGGLDRRIRGPFSHWMTFSGFLLVCDLLLVAELLFGMPRLRRLGRLAIAWRALALVAVNGALLASLTRSAWLGLAVGLLLAVALRRPRLLLAAPLAAVLFVLLAPVPILGRVLSTADLADPSNYDRLCMAQAGMGMIGDAPVTGVGPEMVKRRYPIYRPPTAPRSWVPHLHNTYLQLAAERGLPALAAYLVLVVAALVGAVRLYRSGGGRRGPRADLAVGAITALVAFSVAGLFEHNWGDTEVQRLVLFVMALPFCLPGEPREGDAGDGAGGVA